MTRRTWARLGGAAVAALLAAGCSRHVGPLQPWPLDRDPVVFEDAFTGKVNFEAFGNSKLDALNTSTTQQYAGSGCIQVTVPNAGYAGGAFTSVQARDLSGYNALVFWARASRAASLDVAGLGNDNTGRSRYEASRRALALTTTWTRYVVPIPSPRRLAGGERGLFFFAAAPQAGSGYTVWFDEIRFERLAGLSSPRPAITPQTLSSFVGATLAVTGTRDTFDVDQARVVVDHMPGYFSYSSSAPDVAEVAEDGRIRVLTPGVAVITARLDTTLASGAVTLNAASFTPGAAPIPAPPAADVISLFSNAYVNRPVDRWSADWDVADVTDLGIFGDDFKLYTNLSYAGIEFTSHPVDATAMTAFHADVWAPSGTLFKIKLVDFGANGAYGGGDDREHELAFGADSLPAFVPGTWSGLEIPLARFSNLTTRGHLAQLILSSPDARTVYVDNVYFHR